MRFGCLSNSSLPFRKNKAVLVQPDQAACRSNAKISLKLWLSEKEMIIVTSDEKLGPVKTWGTTKKTWRLLSTGKMFLQVLVGASSLNIA